MPIRTRNKASVALPPATSKVQVGGLRQDLKQYTRDKILAAALSSFQQKGFKETTVERIVEIAGTTAPTFYRHFSGKDDLLPSLQAHLNVIVMECLDKLTPADIASPVSLTRWLREYMVMWDAVHHLCNAFWDAAELKERMSPNTFAEMFKSGAVIKRLMPDIDGEDLDERMRRMGLIMLMLDRLAHLVSISPDKKTSERLIRSFADMIWQSVFAR